MYENTLKDWSNKKIKLYKQCPFSVYLKYIKREPEPPPNPKYEEKRQRGIVFHDVLEEVVNTGYSEREGLIIKPDILDLARDLHAQGAMAEKDEFFDRRWQPMVPQRNERGYPSGHWLVVKKDYRLVTDDYILTGDWKTGKKHGNELDHFLQMKLYALTDFIKYPGYPEYSVELQYLDQDETWSHTFKPHQLEAFHGEIDRDVAIMFEDTMFRPKPNIFNCRYCPYNKTHGTGVCPVAAV